ncbi:hypothetical protein TRIP_D300119 [uncultured Paludibacter sp.]|nr:hypothetical protein TRIP_D300119 [uncultured Paludibacter sp.]
MSYQISPDQNTITINGNIYEFIEKNPLFPCDKCAFDGVDYYKSCDIAPCYPARRKDQKNGIFKLKK